ncbi:MAG TPA: hypothetical protein DIS76_00120, partial [Rhodospirillaceae bacterium]|nr:hypothetical protein [Rhodospirillaceae bacterium]
IHIIEDLSLPRSADPRILVPGKNDAAIWNHRLDPRTHGDVRQLLDALDGRELVLLIRTQDSPTEMLKSLWTQVREQLPSDDHYHYPFLMKEFANQVHGFAGRTGAGVVQLRLSSHGTPIESLSPEKSATYYQATAYDGDSRRDSALRKASLELTLGAAGTGGVDPQKLAKEVQPEDGRPFLLLCLGADETSDTMPMSAQIKLNEALVEREAADTVYTSPVSDEITAASMKEQEIKNRVATLEMLADIARNPDADAEVKEDFVKKLNRTIKEISKPDVLAKLPVGVALAATEALSDLAENHPVMNDPEMIGPGDAIEMVMAAQKVRRVVVDLAPEGALETLHIKTPANENRAPVVAKDEQLMMTAVIEARVEQIKTLFEKLDAPDAAEGAAQLLDKRTLSAVEAQPAVPEAMKAKLAEVGQQIKPLRRQLDVKSDAKAELQAIKAEELKVIDPKGAFKIAPKSQESLRALQEQLKADPKLREELSKNKEIAPLVETLSKADFENPRDVAKLAAQIAKLPKEARAEISKVVPTGFAEAAQEITQAVTMDALLPKLQEPLEALKDAPLPPEQKEKLEAIAQQLATAKDPEAIREIVKQLNEVIADLPPQVTVELPQLKEFAEVIQKWESEPAVFDQFVAESVKMHADEQIQVIEHLEAAHLSAEIGAKLDLTLDALGELPLDPAQQEQLQEIIDQLEGADPAQFKEIIAQLNDLMTALPPEAVKQLPPAIAEIHEGLKSADLSALTRLDVAVQAGAEIGSKIELTLDALKELPLTAAQQKELKEIAKQLETAEPAQLKDIIAKMEGVVKTLPPEALKQLPPAIAEIREGLKSADLSVLAKAEISPQMKSEIGMKLAPALKAMAETPMTPADRKQFQEITHQLSSANPAEVRRAIQKMDRLVAAMPPETKLPPAVTELRTTLRGVEQPSIRSFSSFAASKFKAAPAPEFKASAATVAAIRQFQTILKSAPATSGLPLSAGQIETLVKADLSNPQIQRQMVAMLQSSAAANSNQPQPHAPQSRAAKQLQSILKIQGTDSAAHLPAGQIAQGPMGSAGQKPVAARYEVALTQTMGSSSLFRIANDPNAPPAVREQAQAMYYEQLKREQLLLLEKLIQSSEVKNPAQIKIQQLAVVQSLDSVSKENDDLKKRLQQEQAMAAAAAQNNVVGVVQNNNAATTMHTVPMATVQEYQATAFVQQDMQVSAMAAAASIANATVMMGQGVVPQSTERFEVKPELFNAPEIKAPIVDEFKIPDGPSNPSPEQEVCKKDCGNCHAQCGIKDAFASVGAKEAEAEARKNNAGDPNAGLQGMSDLAKQLQANKYTIADNILNQIPPDAVAAGKRYHDLHPMSGDPEECPVVGPLIKAQKKAEAERGAAGGGDAKALKQGADSANSSVAEANAKARKAAAEAAKGLMPK